MRLKIFRATSMAAAMARLRTELGADALILESRRVAGGVEITAALEPAPQPVAATSTRLAALAWHGVPAELHLALAHGDLEQAIGLAFRFGALPLDACEQPLMLAGPPGAGKTLTIARLATRLVMRGDAPCVITTDDARAGATEQLASFTRLLDVPLMVASNAVSLVRALAERRNGAPVLIDTAGSDPFNNFQAEELTGLAAAAGARIAVVLPAGLDPAEAADLAEAYGSLGALYLIATRLDVARRLGSVVAAAAASHLPLTEAGIAPGVADGLVRFTPSLLAARLCRSEGANDAI